MEDWQWAHVQDLFKWAFGENTQEEPFWFEFVPNHIIDRMKWVGGKKMDVVDPLRVYEYFIDGMIGRPFRGWNGFEAGPILTTWFLYRDALPGPAQESYKNFWSNWLMPDRESVTDPFLATRHDNVSGRLIHPMADDPRVDNRRSWDAQLNPLQGRFDSYWAATGDWRGNKSFYRTSITMRCRGRCSWGRSSTTIRDSSWRTGATGSCTFRSGSGRTGSAA
jgi:hypothetical protein